MSPRSLNIRWTIGDVSLVGFESLRLSIAGMARLFGAHADYHVCVNTISVAEARRRCGAIPDAVRWHAVSRTIPDVLQPFLDGTMSEGTAWKFIPLQIDPGVRELALDNDVILWELPTAMAEWLAADGDARLIAADVTPCHGQFADLCGPAPRNSGIRGTPAGFDFAGALAEVLARRPVKLQSELDEQGLQIAALSLAGPPHVVAIDDVSICSPFPPHLPGLGCCGAHFVGLNARSLPWQFYGRPALEVRREHWEQLRPAVYRRLCLEPELPLAS